MEVRQYIVVSPEVYFSGGGYEPPEYGCCAVEVEAPSKRMAILMAIRTREFYPWVRDQRGDGKNPFTGVEAIDVSELDKPEDG